MILSPFPNGAHPTTTHLIIHPHSELPAITPSVGGAETGLPRGRPTLRWWGTPSECFRGEGRFVPLRAANSFIARFTAASPDPFGTPRWNWRGARLSRTNHRFWKLTLCSL